MSWAEVGLTPKAEGARRGLEQSGEARGTASAGRPQGSAGVGQVVERAESLGTPAPPCPHGQVLWASAGRLRDPESQGWHRPGHCVGEVMGPGRGRLTPRHPAGPWQPQPVSQPCLG